jgi:hypothetical protein
LLADVFSAFPQRVFRKDLLVCHLSSFSGVFVL